MGNGIGSFLRRYLEIFNISQASFAESLGITPKHLNEIINKNIDISDELILAISLVTDFDVSYLLKLENNKKMVRYFNKEFINKGKLKEFLKSFYLNEIEKNNWITFTHKEDPYSNGIDLLKFFKVRNFHVLEEKKKNILYKKNDSSDDNKVLLWIARCDNLAMKQNPDKFTMSNIDLLIEYLKQEQNKRLNIEEMVTKFNELGMYLVVTSALKGTKIRGCAKVKRDKPTIYLTTLYKDKASFYFALYHEIGHIKKNYSMAKNKCIIDSDENIEREADIFAIDVMIPRNIWNKVINSGNIEKEALIQSNQYKIPICFFARRLAKEGYIKYSSAFYNTYIEKI